MPHPERERSLQIELATALRERDEARATTEKWLRVVEQLRENLNATLLERDEARHGLDEWCKAAMQERAEVKRLRDVLTALLAFPGSNAADHEKCDEECPYEQARAALAAPAAGEEK